MSLTFRLKGNFDSLEPEAALLWEAGCQGIVEEGDELVAYFAEHIELPLPGHWQEREDQDWIAAYYAALQPIVLEKLIIAPSHIDSAALSPTPEQRLLRLDPGMAFGSGHHATTYLALQALEHLDLSGKRVLDVGAGSGILAIAADALGAAQAQGCDIDPQTLRVAQENAQHNASKAEFRLGSLDADSPAHSADILLANLYAELHVQLAPHYAQVLPSGGLLLATGILAERLPMVTEALEPFFSMEAISHIDSTAPQTIGSDRDDVWRLIRARRY